MSDTTRCPNGTCYETEAQPNGQIKVWSSRYPENGSVVFDADEYAEHLRRAKAGALDHLVQAVAVPI